MDKETIMECIKRIDKGETIEDVAHSIKIKPEYLRAKILDCGGTNGRDILINELLIELPVSIDYMKREDKKENSAIAYIKGEFEKGKNISTIAKEIGININKLRDILLKYESYSGKKITPGIGKKNRRYDLDSEEMREKIVDAYRNGMPIMQIAEKLGCSQVAILGRIDEYKAKTRENIEKERKSNLVRGRKKRKSEDTNPFGGEDR